MKDGELIS